MSELFDMDLATVDEVESVEEAIQRLQAFIVETEFTPEWLDKWHLLSWRKIDGFEFLSKAMTGPVVDENLSDDPDEVECGREASVGIRCEAQQILDMVRARKSQTAYQTAYQTA